MTNTNLPVRRGVVIRANGISDSYGTSYVRDHGTGQLHRVGAKQNNPNKLRKAERRAHLGNNDQSSLVAA